MRRLRSLALVLAAAFFALPAAHAQDMRITLPKRSKPTPVQQLNRDGVKAVEKHEYDKAKKLFYKAYLLDPNDPFTLNNLGYISELDGELDRAQRYYGLAADLSSDATVDKATSDSVEGKSVAEVAGNAGTTGMEINRLNIQAMSLLMHDRTQEAEVVLGKALQLDTHNPFTLNNIGYMREQEGELESALSYYSAAAARQSQEPIVVALKAGWRGKPISEIADRNVKNVRRSIEKLADDPNSRVAQLNLRGVGALNRNDVRDARNYFQQAYKLDPNNAFALNNMGYLAELDGDRETAQFYYARAREAQYADRKVTVSTKADLTGQPLRDVAQYGDNKVEAKIQQVAEMRRREGSGMVALRRRDGSTVVEPPMPPPKAPMQIEMPANDQPSEVIPPLPDNQQPPATNGRPGAQPNHAQPPVQGQPGDVMPPLPDNQQPPAARQPSTAQPPVQGQPGDVIPPLPDNQQPPAARQPNTQPPPTQGQAGDVIPPLPDSQQPPEVRNQQQPKPPVK